MRIKFSWYYRTIPRARRPYSPFATPPTIFIWRPARTDCVCISSGTMRRKCCRWNSIYTIIAGTKWPSGEEVCVCFWGGSEGGWKWDVMSGSAFPHVLSWLAITASVWANGTHFDLMAIVVDTFVYLHFQFISINVCAMKRTLANTWHTCK